MYASLTGTQLVPKAGAARTASSQPSAPVRCEPFQQLKCAGVCVKVGAAKMSRETGRRGVRRCAPPMRRVRLTMRASQGTPSSSGPAPAPAPALRSPPPLLQPISGAIFDLDGTLVDSEFLTPLAWAAVLREVGASLPEGDEGAEVVGEIISTPAMRGSNALEVAQRLISEYGIGAEWNAQWLAARKRSVAIEQVVHGDVDFAPLWYPGVAEAAQRLRAVVGHAGLGLCTSNLRSVVDATLQAGGMSHAFGGGTTVQGDVVDQSGAAVLKPSPDPYVRALRLLGRPAGSVAVLEDSVVGVRSAAAAGAGLVLAVLNAEQEGEEGAAAEALVAAGASGVFRSTLDAVEWCIANAAPDAVAGAHLPAADVRACEEKEAVVRRYFAGVNAQDPAMIASCFRDTVELRDMCGPSRGAPRTATAGQMAERCMEFIAAHPDVHVFFESPPRADRDGQWVWAHWAETGTWAGKSCGLLPQRTPLDVSGHTRFFLEECDGEQKIARQVVYRTFSDWETALTAPPAKKVAEAPF